MAAVAGRVVEVRGQKLPFLERVSLFFFLSAPVLRRIYEVGRTGLSRTIGHMRIRTSALLPTRAHRCRSSPF